MTESNIRNYILNEIARRAPWYTPEWRFNPDAPDAGAALAQIWADLFAGTLERFGHLPDNYHRTLLNALGSEPLPAVAAHGWLAFTVREDAREIIIPVGTAVSAPANPDAALVTDGALAASPAHITNLYMILPERDAAARYDRFSTPELFHAPQSEPHIWTFSHAFAFQISRSATLQIVPDVSGDRLDILARSPWAYSDGAVWRDLTVIDKGTSLLCVFHKDGGTCCDALRVTLTHKQARDLVLCALKARPSGSELFPDALYADNTQEIDGFHPFGRRFLPGVCAYFAHSDALTKPGARVELSFTLDYENFAIEGYPETEIRLKRLMHVSDFTPPEIFEVTAAEVKWEYYNGIGWAALAVENESAARVLNGQTNGRIKIAFDCPNDLQTAVVGAHDLPFIRARLVTADNLFRQRGHYKSPRLSAVRFAYRYATGIPITDVRVSEYFDTRVVDLPAKLVEAPTGPAACCFAFDRAITHGTVLIDIAAGTQAPATATQWEYWTDNGWTPLDVRDETYGLSKTGILQYHAPLPSVPTRLWGQDAHWLRLACGEAPYNDAYARRPRLLGLYENAIHATAHTLGEASVLPANAFTTLLTPTAGVMSATNPLPTYGGAEAENEIRIIARLDAGLSHHGRAVTALDHEALALEASTRILRARYYAHTDKNGGYAHGEACLVLLPLGAESAGFDDLRDCVYDFLTPRRALGAEILHIIQPRYVAVSIYARVAVKNPDRLLLVKQRINEALARLFTPADWGIGRLSTPGQIDTTIRAVEGVAYLAKTKAAYEIRPGIAVDYASASGEAFTLPVNGRHEILFER